MNDTPRNDRNQAQNGYGRIPDDLLPRMVDLTHLEAHVFLVLCIVANRKRDPIGAVCLSRTELARMVGITRWNLRRALVGLEAKGLILPDSQEATSDSQEATHCLMVSHYLTHSEPPPDSQEATKSLYPQRNVGVVRPSNEVKTKERSEEEGDDVLNPQVSSFKAALREEMVFDVGAGFTWNEDTGKIDATEDEWLALGQIWKKQGMDGDTFGDALRKLERRIATRQEAIPIDPGMRLNKWLTAYQQRVERDAVAREREIEGSSGETHAPEKQDRVERISECHERHPGSHSPKSVVPDTGTENWRCSHDCGFLMPDGMRRFQLKRAAKKKSEREALLP